jgi:glycosyltransferase involved in cell wall biosynthesis
VRILHIYEVANVARGLADAQRALGHDARVLARRSDVLDAPDLAFPARGGPMRDPLQHLVHVRSVGWADAVHIHGGVRRTHVVWPVLRRLRRRTAWVVHLHGSDARMGYGTHHLGFADRIFASTPDLPRLVPRAEWLPTPVSATHAGAPWREEKLLVGHFPTNRSLKGTDRLLEAFGGLGLSVATQPERGVTRIETDGAVLLVVEGVRHARALGIMAGCDLVVDQLAGLGAYGVVSVEAMAHGKVVVSDVDPTLYPEAPPIVRATPDTIADVLRTLVRSRETWPEWGRRGREYAARVHDPNAVAQRTIRAYEEALAARG